MIEIARKVIRIFLDPFEGRHRRGKDKLLYPYLCPAGKATIGLGSLCRDLSVAPITDEVAELMAQKEISMILKKLRVLSPVLFAPRHSRLLIVIVDFCYNLGCGAYSASTLRRAVNSDADNVEAIQAQLRRWVHGGGRKLRGLTLRRAAECRFIAR